MDAVDATLLPPAAAARRLAITVHTLQTWLSPRTIRYPAAELDAWLARCASARGAHPAEAGR